MFLGSERNIFVLDVLIVLFISKGSESNVVCIASIVRFDQCDFGRTKEHLKNKRMQN